MVATRFAVALHILLLLGCGQRRASTTSQTIAESVNTNPVVVRRITGQLARAGLVRVRRGPGGAELTRSPDQITLADVWKAMNVGRSSQVLTIHACPNMLCPVGRDVHSVLGHVFEDAEAAMLSSLDRTTLADLLQSLTPAAPVADTPVTAAA